LILQSFCEEAQIPLVHGAIAGWYGQVTTIFPGDRTLDRLYKDASDRGLEDELGNPSFTPATIASIQVSEALKVITGKEEVLRKKILMIDLLDNEFHIIEME
jgi:molybdopterin/thiamine biosynthesis adenylyltransferase